MSGSHSGPVPVDDLTDKVFRVGQELAYVCVLSALWIVFAIPLVTIPAATVGVYASLIGHMADGNREYVRPFWRAFRGSFRRVTSPFFALLTLALLFGFDALYYLVKRPMSISAVVLGATQLTLAALAIASSTFLCGISAHAQVNGSPEHRPTLRRAVSAAWQRPLWSIVIAAVVIGVPVALAWLGLWQFGLFVVGAVCYANARVMVRLRPWSDDRRRGKAPGDRG